MWEDKLKIYDKIVDKCPNYERKGKNMIYTSANSNMFTLLNKAGEIGKRFSKEKQEKLMLEHQTTIYKCHGAVMKGYVLVLDTMFKDLDLLASYFNKSFNYVMSLEPK